MFWECYSEVSHFGHAARAMSLATRGFGLGLSETGAIDSKTVSREVMGERPAQIAEGVFGEFAGRVMSRAAHNAESKRRRGLPEPSAGVLRDGNGAVRQRRLRRGSAAGGWWKGCGNCWGMLGRCRPW